MKVFVSSTYEDLVEYRQAVKDAIIAKQHVPIMMETLIPEGENPPKEECLENVDESDIFIGIYAYRYGFIPEGDKFSITEQEYNRAVDENKKRYCFVLHTELEKEWPKEHNKEVNQKLRDLRGKILNENYVKFFKNPDELKFLVTQVLPFDTKETRFDNTLEAAQETAKKIDSDKKLILIDQLIQENEYRRINDEGFRYSINLIASNFRSFDRRISYEFINYTKRLLIGKCRFRDYVKSANELTKKIRRRKFIGKATFAGSSFLIAGIILTLFAYQINFLGIRSTFLSPSKANRIDFIKWLTKKNVGENIVYDNVKNPGTIKAIVALGFAYDLDPKNREINSALEQIISDIKRIIRPKDVSYDMLSNNMMILEEIHRYVPYPPLLETANILKARVTIQKLEIQFNDSSVSNADLLEGYRNLWENYIDQIDINYVKKKITTLQEAVSEFENLKQKTSSDTITITQKRDLWQMFAELQRDCPEKTFAKNEIKNVNQYILKNASISTDDNFVVCRNVVNLKPQGIMKTFSSGTVSVWAKVCAPCTENVMIKWYANDQLYDEFSINIEKPNVKGYRIYAMKRYGDEQRGRNEVRLYNSKNILIGRKVFFVQ